MRSLRASEFLALTTRRTGAAETLNNLLPHSPHYTWQLDGRGLVCDGESEFLLTYNSLHFHVLCVKCLTCSRRGDTSLGCKRSLGLVASSQLVREAKDCSGSRANARNGSR